MVKKLFKHEILSYLRLLIPLYGVLLGISLLGRIVQFFETDSVAYDIVSVSSVIMFVIALFACLLLGTIFCVIRFHKNLFTGEGYLTFTLPVTATQHLLVKLVTAVAVSVLSVIAILLSVCIFTAGDVLVEVVKAISYVLGDIYDRVGNKAYHLTFYILEMFLLLLVSTFYQYLVFYSCVSLGQTARKNRVLAAVGFYFAYYMITQILGTVLIVVLTLLQNSILWTRLTDFISNHSYAFVHLMFGTLILFYALVATGFFFLNRRVIRRKLNLE